MMYILKLSRYVAVLSSYSEIGIHSLFSSILLNVAGASSERVVIGRMWAGLRGFGCIRHGTREFRYARVIKRMIRQTVSDFVEVFIVIAVLIIVVIATMIIIAIINSHNCF